MAAWVLGVDGRLLAMIPDTMLVITGRRMESMEGTTTRYRYGFLLICPPGCTFQETGRGTI